MPRFKLISGKLKSRTEESSWPDDGKIDLTIEINNHVKMEHCLKNIRANEAKQIIKFLQKYFNL